MNKVLALIPARKGSKGVKNKNIRPLFNKPLIAYTIEAAISSGLFDDVVVSTDSTEISDIARAYGASIPFIRPWKFARDSSSTIEVVIHCLSFMQSRGKKFDEIMVLQPTSPFRKAEHIREAYEMYLKKKADFVISICKSEHSPLWMNTINADLKMDYFIQESVKNVRRQDLPQYYRLNGAIFLAKIDRMLQEKSFFGENSYAYIMDRWESIDIDDELDFKFCQFIMGNIKDTYKEGTEKMIYKKPVVAFACLNKSNVFSSYLLSKMFYNNYYKILLVSDYVFTEEDIRRIGGLGVWDEIIYFRETKVPLPDFFKEIRKQLESVDFSRIDILHFFSFGHKSYNFNLFDYIPEKTKIIQTVFSVAEHYTKEYWTMLKEGKFINGTDINLEYLKRFSEIWVYDKRLYIGDTMNLPVKDIPIKDFFKRKAMNKFCSELNQVFDYYHSLMDYDVLFLDQPVASKYFNNRKDEEIKFFSRIYYELIDFKVLIKNHPKSLITKYNGIDVKIMTENKVPWEVILFNEMNEKKDRLQDKIFVSYLSAALVNTHIFLNLFNIPGKAFWLGDLLIQHTQEPIGYTMYKNFIERLKELYTESFYDIKTFEELRTIIMSLSYS